MYYIIIVNHILFSSGTTLTYLFQVPGLGGVLSAFCCTPGTITSCADDLKAGNLLGLAPGGVYEAQFSDNHYKLEWKRYSFVFHYNQRKKPIPNKQNVTMLFYHLLFHYLVVLDLPKLQLKQKFQSFQFLPKTSEKLFEP